MTAAIGRRPYAALAGLPHPANGRAVQTSVQNGSSHLLTLRVAAKPTAFSRAQNDRRHGAFVFEPYSGKNKGEHHALVNSPENSLPKCPKTALDSVQRVRGWGKTLSVTVFSVAQTEKSVALSLREPAGFRRLPRRLASICRGEALHVVGRKTHVFRTVCKAYGMVGPVSGGLVCPSIFRSAERPFEAKHMGVWGLFSTFAANKIMFVDPLFPHIRTI